jgi:hypothetical protein
MAGLSLGMGGPAAWAVPNAAQAPTGPSTIGQKAFGVYSNQTGNAGPRTAAYGTIALGVAGAAVLAWLWWSLPR